ncbi:hypothetical protein [Rhodoferax sp.]|uniref:hypothetical protein n=1 Tax=Rhodoferax sp. TaxID=50421 RepID=UPI002ACDB2FA|nr:hypothetical protein [Rhodoferax sp.]MDZ7918696.1 hypothetical protein [Rhodoferax sp.]
MSPRFTPSPVWCLLYALWIAPALAASDADLAQNLDRYSTSELEAACARMSSRSHVSGLTDGAWMALPFGGRTYYYRSACYQELARRTGNASWCTRVEERKTLFGDGSGVSPAQCERQVAQVQSDRAEQQASAARHAAAVKGAFTVRNVTATEQMQGDWQLQVALEGRLAGRYQLEVARLTPKRVVLVSEELKLEHDTLQRWLLPRHVVLGPTTPPMIAPLAVSLSYLPPVDDRIVLGPHLTSIYNLTLSLP